MLTSIAVTVLSLFGLSQPAQAQSASQITAQQSPLLVTLQADLKRVPMRALPDVIFDYWLQALDRSSRDKTLSSAPIDATSILNMAQAAPSYRNLYANLLVQVRQTQLQSADRFVALADSLFAARSAVRRNQSLAPNERYARMTLLEFLGEETLYLASRKFPGEIKSYVRTYGQLPSAIRVLKTADLRGIEVVSGDIVLSKFSGTGSSSFIALLTERPSIYSHAATVFVEPLTGKLLSPEAFIEDGVRLRSMQGSYIDTPKTRMFVFRAKNDNQVNRMTNAALGVSDFVETLYKRVADPMTTSAFDYNFSMQPGQKEAFSCVETVLEAYNRGGLTDALNPYPSNLWGEFDKDHKEIFANFLEIKAPRFPSPGDLDMNSNFDLAGFSLDVPKLGQERAEMAALDAVFTLIAMDNQRIRENLKVFDTVGSNRVTPAQLAYLRTLPFIPKEMRDKLTTEIPPNISLKQLVFFGYLNQAFTPQVRDAVMAEAAKLEAIHGRPPGLNEMRLLALKHSYAHVQKMMTMAKEFQARAH